MKDKLTRLANHYGIDSRIDKLNEEICELIVSAIHYNDRGFNKHEVIDEIVDVEILIDEICILTDSDIDMKYYDCGKLDYDSMLKDFYTMGIASINFKTNPDLKGPDLKGAFFASLVKCKIVTHNMRKEYAISDTEMISQKVAKVERQLKRIL